MKPSTGGKILLVLIGLAVLGTARPGNLVLDPHLLLRDPDPTDAQAIQAVIAMFWTWFVCLSLVPIYCLEVVLTLLGRARFRLGLLAALPWTVVQLAVVTAVSGGQPAFAAGIDHVLTVLATANLVALLWADGALKLLVRIGPIRSAAATQRSA